MIRFERCVTHPLTHATHTHSLTPSLTHATHTHTHSLTHSIARLTHATHSLTLSHSTTHPFRKKKKELLFRKALASISHCHLDGVRLTHPLTHSHTHPLTHSLTHSSTHRRFEPAAAGAGPLPTPLRTRCRMCVCKSWSLTGG